MSDAIARPAPGSIPDLAQLKSALRITAPVVHMPSHGTSQFSARATRPGNGSTDYLSFAALDFNAGEQD